jgi:hypothetical protein
MTRLFGALLFLAMASATADVRDTPAERALSLPSGGPTLVLKRDDWVISREQRRPGDTAVYYLLSSERLHATLSVYIDKTEACRSADACLAQAVTNVAYKNALEKTAAQSGPFKAALFYLDNPGGAQVKQANILAAAYVDGHWIDIHISKVDSQRPDMAPLRELLQSLVVR